MTETKGRFKHYPVRPKRLSAGFVKKEYAKLFELLPQAEAAESAQLWLELFEHWNALKSYIGSEASRVGFKYSQDMGNKAAETAEKYFREKISPAVSKPEHELTKALLASRHKDKIASRYGKQLLVDYEISLKPLDPINTDLRVKASSISTSYEKTVAQAEVEFRGQKLNLSKSRSLLFSDDNETRQEIYLKVGDWVLANRVKLADKYSKLVSLRHQMAANLGFDSYIPFSYQLHGRTDYGVKEVEAFRELVLKYAVPVYAKYAAVQARNLKTPTLRPWDLNHDPATGLPLGVVPVKGQLDKAERMFNKLSPKLAKHFRYMRRHGLIDLETRRSKQAGAYCTSFEDEQKVAIFCNSTGDAEDIRVLTHEMGHAFQGLESQHIEAVELRWGTAELAEVFSMGMEYLSLPYMEEFFTKEQADKFAAHKWSESAFTLCWVAIVDEFQHWVYENPKATPAERDKAWEVIYSKYLGVVDFSGLSKYKKTRWYLQSHIFTLPFYYIDYALAEICALQLALISSKNHKAAMETYLRLCRLGGTRSFLQAVDEGGMRSPFDEELFKELMAYTADKLGV